MSENRFIVEKNAISYLKNNPSLIPTFLQDGITKKENFSYEYFGDKSFASFFRLDIEKIKYFSSNYEIEYLLKNINYNNIKENVTSFFNTFCENIKPNKSMYIINTHSLNMAFIGKIIESTGRKNVVYSFNKEFYINSSSNSLEGVLLLFAIKNSDYLNELINEIKKPFIEKLNILNKESYFYIDENNKEKSKIDLIDNYLKTQIGYKNPRSIYRVDKYVTKDFLIEKSIFNVVFFDSDNDFGNSFNFLKSQLKDTDIKVEIINYKKPNNDVIGIYEKYLIEQNKKYIDYKFDILSSNENLAKKYKTPKKYENIPNYNINQNNKKEEIKINPLVFIPYGIGLVILLISMLLSNHTPGTTGSSYGGNNHGGYTSGGGYSSYGGSNSSSYKSSTSSKSSIRSFGGGGFSKSFG